MRNVDDNQWTAEIAHGRPLDRPGARVREERRDAVENRRRILDAARRLFAEHGVPAVNMAEIAEAAGVGKGTLYRRYGSKGELCFALMDEELSQFQDHTLGGLQGMFEQQTPWLLQLAWFVEELVAFTGTHAPLLYEVRQMTERTGRLEVAHVWQYMTVQGLLRRALAAGELPESPGLAFLTDLLLAPLSALYFDFLRRARGYSVEEIGRELRQTVLMLGRAQPHPSDGQATIGPAASD
jgi:AcrR family transcriptional regulator